jgi:hypothetical protein
MMDKKYAGKAVVLPKDTAERIEAVQAQLSAQLGFRPSTSEVISYLAQFWADQTKGAQ